MNNDEHKKMGIIKSQLNEVGYGFCAAKWFTSTIWLQNGMTSSCHHPPAHKIELSDINNNPSGLHNTAYKKQQRKEMILEQRPSECSYCWQVEDKSPESISDRYIKSSAIPWADIFNDVVDWQTYPEDVITITPDSYKRDFNPRVLEVSFDNLCNLDCSYCNTEFSSTWASDINKNGAYTNLKTKSKGTWEKAIEFDYDPKTEENVYTKSFFEWFDSGLKDDLIELRVTGGEPIRSPSFWKLVNKCEDVNFKFSVNSNMMLDTKRLSDLVSISHKFNDFDLFTSCETYGTHAEFIRQGLRYDQFLSNIKYFSTHAKYTNVTFMLTINALSLFGITKFLDDIVKLKQHFNNVRDFRMSINILRFPSFQSVNILPIDIKNERADDIDQWLDTNVSLISESDKHNVQRLVAYLRNISTSYEDSDSTSDKLNDFFQFYTQYAERHNTKVDEVFIESDNFIQWWSTLRDEYGTK